MAAVYVQSTALSFTEFVKVKYLISLLNNLLLLLYDQHNKFLINKPILLY
jgi:hypothetical protein